MSNLFRLGYQKWHLLLNVKIALMVMLHEGSPYGSSPLLFIITFFLPFLFCWYCYILCILICRRQSCSCQQWRNSKWILRYIIDGMKCNDFSGTCWTPLNGCHQQSTRLSPFISADLNILFKFTRFGVLYKLAPANWISDHTLPPPSVSLIFTPFKPEL